MDDSFSGTLHMIGDIQSSGATIDTGPDRNDVVYILDDSEDVLDALKWLVESVGLTCVAYSDPQAFLEAEKNATSGCIVLDLRMPGMSGLDMLAELNRRKVAYPVIMLSAHGDVDSAVRAMKAGAYDFVQKPYSDQALLDTIQHAIEQSKGDWTFNRRKKRLESVLETLTPRERDVLSGLVAGKTSKVIARDLGLSHRTVDNHRVRLLAKTGAGTGVELVRDVIYLELGLKKGTGQ